MPVPGSRPSRYRDPMPRFTALYQVNEEEIYAGTSCHDWIGWTNREGYGMFMDENWRDGAAMRWIFQKTFGPLGDLVTDHLCRRPICVNPYHAEAVTHTENKRRGLGWAGMNYQKTHCKRGHEFTEENTYHPPTIPHGRSCRACSNLRQKGYTAKNKSKVPAW